VPAIAFVAMAENCPKGFKTAVKMPNAFGIRAVDSPAVRLYYHRFPFFGEIITVCSHRLVAVLEHAEYQVSVEMSGAKSVGREPWPD
jgi:hypothetical protein